MLTNYNNLSDKEKKKYEKSLKAMYIILGIATIFFYVLPFLCIFTGKLSEIFTAMLLINVNTIFVFIACLMHSRKYDFNVMPPLALAIFYMPTVIIFYGDLRFIMFCIIYFVLGLFGEFTGHLFVKRKKSNKQPFGLNRLANGKKEKKSKKKVKK